MAIGGYGYTMTPRKIGVPQQEQQVQQQQTPLRDDLATVEELTDNYYNAYQTMKDYVSEMAKEYNVDVTKPSFKERGGGLLHQGYQKFEAALQMAANDLAQYKNTLESEEKERRAGTYLYNPNFDPRSKEGFEAQGSQRGFTTKLLPHVEAAIKQLSITRMSNPAATEATEKYKLATERKIDEMIAQGVISSAQGEFNKKALYEAMAETPASTINAGIAAEARRQTARGKNEGMFPLMKKFVVDASGGGDLQQYQRVQDPKTGDIAYRKRADWVGLNFGPDTQLGIKNRVADYVEVSPSGEVTLHFQKTIDDNNEPVEPTPLQLHSMRPNEIINLISEHNPRFMNPQIANKLLTEGGFMDELGSTDLETFLGQEGMSELSQRQQALANRASREKEVIASIENELSTPNTKKGSSRWGGDTLVNLEETFNLPDGTEIKFTPHTWNNKSYYMDKDLFKELIPENDRENFKYEKMSKSDIIKVLRRVGYVNSKVDEMLTDEQKTTPSTETTNPINKFLPPKK